MPQGRILDIPTRVREKVRRHINGRSLISFFPRRFDSRAIHSVAHTAQKHAFLPVPLVTAIEAVGLHDGTYLHLKNAVKVPNILDKLQSRRAIALYPEHNKFSIWAAKQVEWYLGAAGYIPLVEHYEDGPHLFVHARGIEFGEKEYNRYPHKLPYVYSTVSPNKPFGPSLFGCLKAHKIDVICPDIVVYICMDKSDIRKNVGPFLFTHDSIVQNLKPSTYNHFREVKYNIGPDPTVSAEDERIHGFGGATRIRIFSERGISTGETDGRKYMRFDRERVKHPLNEDGHLKDLWSTIRVIERAQKPIEIDRGDVLLINNRRVAQRWKSRGDYRGWFPETFQREHLLLKKLDRTILRMSFYYPEEIPPEPKAQTSRA